MRRKWQLKRNWSLFTALYNTLLIYLKGIKMFQIYKSYTKRSRDYTQRCCYRNGCVRILNSQQAVALSFLQLHQTVGRTLHSIANFGHCGIWSELYTTWHCALTGTKYQRRTLEQNIFLKYEQMFFYVSNEKLSQAKSKEIRNALTH